jgi:hypothetical protein
MAESHGLLLLSCTALALSYFLQIGPAVPSHGED